MARYPQREHLSRCPPRAAVRQRSMAANTLRCWPVIHRRLASMNFCPATRMRSATSSGGPTHLFVSGRLVFLPRGPQRQGVQGTGGGAEMAVGKVQVNRGLFQIVVTEEHLDGAQVRPRFQQMSGKAVPSYVSEDIVGTMCPS